MDFPEDEYELMYADELEALDDLEQESGSINVIASEAVTNTQTPSETFPDTATITENNVIDINSQSDGQKRSIDHLFGDIDDIDFDVELPVPKKLKTHADDNIEQLALIEHILELRKEAKESSLNFGKSYASFSSRSNNLRNNVSKTLPKWPFTVIHTHDGERLYLRTHSEEFMEEERARFVKKIHSQSIMGSKFQEILLEAKDLLDKDAEIIEEFIVGDTEDKSSLWVDLYKPQSYLELLSDESTNRVLLKWLKLWDRVVFNRRPLKKIQPKAENNFQKKQDIFLEVAEDGRPKYKVVLMCGPPGLGKTTLAHMVAKHAGYKVIEVNASDERSPETFKVALENATTMASVLDPNRRPNCLVFDEIDGAPQVAIDFLVKYISGSCVVSSKKRGKENRKIVLKRPIICICNDVYVPALRNLRQIAFVIHFPPLTSSKLAQRLQEICHSESINATGVALNALSEKSNNDIRSCLSVLHFFKSLDKPLKLEDIVKSDVGEKDVQKGLFNVWQDIFLLDRSKNSHEMITLSFRWRKVMNSVTSFGDYERLAMGVFENYPLLNYKDSTLGGTTESMDWFCFFDSISSKISALQDYSLSGYLQHCFILWHFVFASNQKAKLKFPSTHSEARAQTLKVQGVLDELMAGMSPRIRTFNGRRALALDTLPYLQGIITPLLRPVNLHLYRPQEQLELARVVNTMIDYNLNYVQERNQEGNYVFNLDPDIEKITKYSTTSQSKRVVTSSNRQLISREIELAKMRLLEQSRTQNSSSNASTPKPTKQPQSKDTVRKDAAVLPNHLQKLTPTIKVRAISDKKSPPTKNFFFINKERDCPDKEQDEASLNDVYFLFKEGHTSGMRKEAKISTLL